MLHLFLLSYCIGAQPAWRPLAIEDTSCPWSHDQSTLLFVSTSLLHSCAFNRLMYISGAQTCSQYDVLDPEVQLDIDNITCLRI